jgi:transcriptional regulator with XRE-family HTH domain
MADLTDIAESVRKERKRLRLSQKELALQAKVSRALLAQLESGRLPELGVKKLLRILRAVGLDLRVTTLNLQRPTFEDLLEEETKSQ